LVRCRRQIRSASACASVSPQVSQAWVANCRPPFGLNRRNWQFVRISPPLDFSRACERLCSLSEVTAVFAELKNVSPNTVLHGFCASTDFGQFNLNPSGITRTSPCRFASACSPTRTGSDSAVGGAHGGKVLQPAVLVEESCRDRLCDDTTRGCSYGVSHRVTSVPVKQ
jgi:hypothetical protein